MNLVSTAVLGIAALALTVLFGWLGARPPAPHRGPRLIPWRFMMLTAFLGVVTALVHMVALLKAR